MNNPEEDNIQASLINPPSQPQGAALPPAQGGPGFTASEMAALGGGSPAELHPYTGSEPFQKWNRDNERQAAPASGLSSIDLDALRKQIESDIDSLGKTVALPQEARTEDAGFTQTDAGREMNRWVRPDESSRPEPPKMEVSQIARLSPEERRSAGVSDAAYRDAVRTMDERRRRTSAAAQNSLRRSLSGGGTRGRRMTDDEAFGAEDAIIVSSADSFAPRAPF